MKCVYKSNVAFLAVPLMWAACGSGVSKCPRVRHLTCKECSRRAWLTPPSVCDCVNGLALSGHLLEQRCVDAVHERMNVSQIGVVFFRIRLLL